jgi:hypothetical protein
MEKAAVPVTPEQPKPGLQTDDGLFYTYHEDLNATRPKHGKPGGWWMWIRKHLNFFRIFLLTFVFFPLIMSVILWAVNTEYQVAYVDALYLCYSSFTSTGTFHCILLWFILVFLTHLGLSPIDLSHTTTFQQVLLFVQTFLGSSILISWVVVMIRKYVPIPIL